MFRRVLLLCAAIASSAAAQRIRVELDTRAEVIGILFRVAGAPDFSNGAVQPYIRQVDSAFGPYRNHAVFRDINDLRARTRIALSSVAALAPYLADPISFAARAPSPADQFLISARDFAQASNLQAFLQAEKPVYDSASARLRRLVDSTGDLPWLRRFFGGPETDSYIVSPLLINATGNFGPSFSSDSVHERYAYVGVPTADSLGFPIMAPDVVPTIIHELSHSFINPIVGTRQELGTPGEEIFRQSQRAMRSQAYGSWPTMLNESVVRATVVRHIRAHEGEAAAMRETRSQQGRGFVWMDELVQLLDGYEADRRSYPTLAEFMPRLSEYFTGLAPRLEQKLAAFEALRPRVVYTSIRDSATGVDPRLTSIILRFDKPVDPIVTIVGNHGGGTPELTSASFDSTHTTLTLGVKLEPGRTYSLPFGPGSFVARDGSPLMQLQLSFRTAARDSSRPPALSPSRPIS